VATAVIWIAIASRRSGPAGSPHRNLANALLAILVVQVLSGISNVVFAWPIVVAVLHNGGAAAMALLLALLHTQATESTSSVARTNLMAVTT
jgi:cytochrome c oxidase assembly protein subunit 15